MYLLLQDKLGRCGGFAQSKTGGVAFSNLQALAQAMVDAGIDGQIVVQKDGIGYAITNGYPSGISINLQLG